MGKFLVDRVKDAPEPARVDIEVKGFLSGAQDA
jgi:hypothetical protein